MENNNNSIEAMLEHRDWIQRLAQRLVRDPNDAQDVAQETWLVALRTPPPDMRSPRGWLVRVAQNVARQIARSKKTRSEHEAAAPERDSAPSSDELIDRLSVERSVVEDVAALPEPYRHTILLRYFEQLPPAAIAAQMDAPLATVKTRLNRGLVILRERLDRRHGGDASTWLAALAPIAMQGAAPKALGTGALLLSTKASLAWAVALIVLILGFLGREAFSPTPAVDPELRLSAEPMLADVTVREQAIEVGDIPKVRTSVGVASVTSERTVRVVSALDGLPLPGADIWYIDSEIVRKRAQARFGLELYDPEPDTREEGQHLTCDERGEASLPASDTAWSIIARSGELYGGANALDDDPIEVRCAVDRTVSVQVVDTSGAPLPGILVGLMERDPLGQTHWIRWKQPTRGPSGIAQFRHMGTSLGTTPRTRSALFAVLAFPNAGDVAQPVDLEALDGPILLKAPDTGQLVIDLTDSEGKPYRSDARLQAERFHETPSRGITSERAIRHSVHLHGGSQGVLPHVGLGIDLLVVIPRHGIMKRVERMVQGPTQRGEERRVELQVGAVSAHFSGRISVPPGTEFDPATLVVHAKYWDGEGWEHASVGGPIGGGYAVLEEGRFLLPLVDRVPEGASCRLSFKAESQDAVQLSASCEALAPADGDARDCGEVTLALAPLIASGFVTDQTGRPVPGMPLSLGNKLAQQPPASLAWNLYKYSACQTDDDGRFELRGELPPGEYAVLAKSGGYVDRGWIPIQIGDQSVRVVLNAEARVSGRILADEGFPLQRLVVVACYPEAMSTADPTCSLARDVAYVQPDGRFNLSGLKPGSPRLLVRTGMYSEPLASIESVELTPGENASDERISLIDLRGAAFETSLEIAGPDRQPVELGFVTLLGTTSKTDTQPAPTRFAIEGGRVSLITRHRPIDVEIVSPGLVPVALEGLAEDTCVALGQGLRIQLSVPADLVLPSEPYVLRVGLLGADRENPSSIEPLDMAAVRANSAVYLSDCEERTRGRQQLEWSHGEFDAERRVELGVPHAGLYDVVWSIQSSDEPVGRAGRSVSPDRATRQLEVTSKTASFQITPNGRSYERTLTSLR